MTDQIPDEPQTEGEPVEAILEPDEPTTALVKAPEPGKIVRLREEQQQLAHVPFQLTEAQKDLMARTFFNGCTTDEMVMAFMFCERTRLDPFTGQVHFIKRYDKKEKREVMKPQVSIDGLRLIAERTGEYRGQEGPYWCGPDGVWQDVWLDHRNPPTAAKVYVIREGFDRPVAGIAHWKSYVQTTKEGDPTKFWRNMPEVMLAKVAEALALRKAFPHELGGVYSSEEMDQAEGEGEGEPRQRDRHRGGRGDRRQPAPARPAEQPKHLVDLVAKASQEAGITGDALKAFIAKHFPATPRFKQLGEQALSQLIAKLKAAARERGKSPATSQEAPKKPTGIGHADAAPPEDWTPPDYEAFGPDEEVPLD